MNKDFYQEYVSALLKKANLVDESGKVDDSYVASLSEELKKKIGLMIMNELSADQLDEYAKLIQTNPPAEKLAEFFKQNITDFETKRDKTLENFAYNFLQQTEKMREALRD